VLVGAGVSVGGVVGATTSAVGVICACVLVGAAVVALAQAVSRSEAVSKVNKNVNVDLFILPPLNDHDYH
jgi:hypothetical protein